jgi:hypothetical protein
MDYDGSEKGYRSPYVGTGGILGPKRLFKGIILSTHFDSVWLIGYNQAISSYPKMFPTFISKQVSGWCSCNSKLSLWEENARNQCPQCGYNNKNSKHLT